MEFDFESEEEKAALTGADEAIYQHLGIVFHALLEERPFPARLCGGNLQLTESSEMFFNRRPEKLPLTSHDLQDFIDHGLPSSERCFNFVWNNDRFQAKDRIYDDFFRSVISFRTIEFMVRPLPGIQADAPLRLLMGPGDVQDCLTLALNCNPNQPRTAVLGRGLVKHPQDVRDQRRHPDIQPQRTQIPFEWRIDRADEELIAEKVRRWRISTCKGRDNYSLRLRAYSNFYNDPGHSNPREFYFNSQEERLALEGTDESIHPYLMTYHEARFKKNEMWSSRLHQDDIVVTGSHYNQQPAMPPLTSEGLRDSLENLTALKGYWSILWFSETQYNTDIVYDDNFRSVVTFGKSDIEFMVRPLKHDPERGRLYISTGDLQDILSLAEQMVVEAANRTPAQQIAAVIGQGSVMNPQDNSQFKQVLAHLTVPFEWKIARASNLAARIQVWRCKVCGGTQKYHKRERDYLGYLRSRGLGDPREGQRSSAVVESRKRRMEEVATSQGGGPSYKRRSTGSSQWSSAPQSSVSSPEISRPPSVAVPGQSTMDPPPPVGLGEPATNIEHPIHRGRRRRGSGGSRGGIGSATSRVSSGMATLTLQSPIGGSMEDLGPPHAGSHRGGPQGVPGWASGQSGGEYESEVPTHGQQGQAFPPQIPGHGFQGPGRAQQEPAPGEWALEFGHWVRVPKSLPRGPPRLGIEHTQHFGPHGDWNPQHPGQPQAPVGPAPEQHSFQHGHAGFVDTQSGRGYTGGLGHNMPAFGSSTVQGGGGYSSGFPPRQPAMHGGQFASPHQLQHRAAVPPEGGHDPSILQNVQRTESPGPLDPTAAQFGQRNSPPSVPSSMQPMYQHQDMPPFSPPAMRNIDPAQLLAHTTLPQVGQSYPSSFPHATRPMPAQSTHTPEHEDVPADLGSGSESGSEVEDVPEQSDSESESEEEGLPEHSDSGSESEGRDDQVSHQGTRVTQPLPHTGGHGEPRMYESPQAMPQDPPSYPDVFMGASDDNASDEDNFHRR